MTSTFVRDAKLKFRKGRRATGLSRISNPNPDTYIHVGGSVVGLIGGPAPLMRDVYWKIRLMVRVEPTDAHPVDWKWITLKHDALTETSAREFVQGHWLKLCEMYDVRPVERWD